MLNTYKTKAQKEQFVEGWNTFVTVDDHGRCPFRAYSRKSDGHDAARRHVILMQLDGVVGAHDKIEEITVDQFEAIQALCAANDAEMEKRIGF